MGSYAAAATTTTTTLRRTTAAAAVAKKQEEEAKKEEKTTTTTKKKNDKTFKSRFLRLRISADVISVYPVFWHNKDNIITISLVPQ